MGKIFLFWSIILIVLIAGITAIIYGKMLLKTEEEKTEKIIEEFSKTIIHRVDIPPAPPSEVEEIEETQEDIESPEPVMPLEEQQPLPPVIQ